ncbi:MAG: glycoside hydrolase family 32 protein [Clostridiales bacterium]|nr:glycoside hydrolase family 32 protein [Clostridiales bacterium]
MRKNYQLELNGYSNFLTGVSQEKIIENFTITFLFTPYTYETGMSGIFSAFCERDKNGFALGIGKKGKVTVKIGFGTMIFKMESLESHLEYQTPNIVTVAFWGTAGWCDLSVNGKLSNRKQFPRHSKAIIPAGKYYIGKYVDGNEALKSTKHGIFHGKLSFVEFEEAYISYDKVLAFQKKHGRKTEKINLYENQKVKEDIYRPGFHLMPPGKWMNEPHAPFFYKGRYHIFYQANPHAPVWDNLCWGHLVSEDMMQWEDGGIALCPDEKSSKKELEDIDIDGCWSGSACMDKNGNPILFYTAGDNSRLPNQSIAVALPQDIGDPYLRKWIKQGVILRQSQTEGFLGEYRDPFVFRRGDIYHVLVGTGDGENGGGNVLVYTSENLKDFTCHGFLMEYEYEKCKEVGHVWELPVLLPLNDEKGEYVCDILLFCACQIESEVVETYYFLGKYDESVKKFCKFHEIPMLIDLGDGTFTGPSGFVTLEGRSIVFTIAQGKRNPEEEYGAGWAHNGGMPVELSVSQDQLRISPICEAKKYFTALLKDVNIPKDDKENDGLDEILLLENRVEVNADGDFLEFLLDFGSDFWKISYDRRTQIFQAILGSTGEVISKYRSREDLVDISEKNIEMECYIDHSLTEIYLNHKKSMTLRNYRYEKGYRMTARAGGDCRVKVWEYR